MNKKKIQKIAKYILEREQIIQNSNALDKKVQIAKQEIENKMMTLSFGEIMLVDDFIMSQKRKNNLI